MAISTSNLYGNIAVSREAIRTVAGIAALECYGIWGVGRKRVVRNTASEIRLRNGVRVWAAKNKVGIYIDLIICFGMPVDEIINSVRNTIKYNVENFSGMEVIFVDIGVMGIRK